MRSTLKYSLMCAASAVFISCFYTFSFAQIEKTKKNDGIMIYAGSVEMNVDPARLKTKHADDTKPDEEIKQQPLAGKTSTSDKPWSVELRVKRYFGSHTSYEFGNPDPPFQTPLSRLEFPMNTWWAGGEFRRSFSRFSAGVEALAAIPMESDLSFKDSDWTDPDYPWVRDIYSEAQCRIEPSYMARVDVDLKIADWLRLPGWFDVRPVAGIRWQQLNFLAHNGVQVYPVSWGNEPPYPMPVDMIRFKQTYWQYFLGIKAVYDMEKHIRFPRLKMICRLDWAYVYGYNSDDHLLRGDGGTRMTYENTWGNAWHASLGIKVGLTKHLNAGLAMEYLRIRSEGSHQWQHDVYGIDATWDHGVKVWSDQTSLMVSMEYLF